MKYSVEIPKRVQKEISKIPLQYQIKIFAALAVLAENPYIGKKLSGERKGEWTIRAWPYRIIYQIRKKELLVLVIKVGHRGGVYR